MLPAPPTTSDGSPKEGGAALVPSRGLAARLRSRLALRLGPLLESPTKVGVLLSTARVRLGGVLGRCLRRARALSLLSVKLPNAQLLRSRILLHGGGDTHLGS